METKANNPIKYLEGKEVHPIIEFFFQCAHLKQLFRQGWLQRNIPKETCESVADHSFSTAILAYIIAEEYFPELDSSKAAVMALIHDLPEVYAGDITPDDNVPIEEKRLVEQESIKRLFSNLTNGRKYLKLWEEYENQSSEEAKFVKQIDKLEMALQALVYEHHGFTNLEDFFQDARRRISDPRIKKILEDAIKIRKDLK